MSTTLNFFSDKFYDHFGRSDFCRRSKTIFIAHINLELISFISSDLLPWQTVETDQQFFIIFRIVIKPRAVEAQDQTVKFVGQNF